MKTGKFQPPEDPFYPPYQNVIHLQKSVWIILRSLCVNNKLNLMKWNPTLQVDISHNL